MQLTKSQLLDKIQEVMEMDQKNVNEYGLKVSLSVIDEKAKKFLYKAIDLRKEQLQQSQDNLVENGEFDYKELMNG